MPSSSAGDTVTTVRQYWFMVLGGTVCLVASVFPWFFYSREGALANFTLRIYVWLPVGAEQLGADQDWSLPGRALGMTLLVALLAFVLFLIGRHPSIGLRPFGISESFIGSILGLAVLAYLVPFARGVDYLGYQRVSPTVAFWLAIAGLLIFLAGSISAIVADSSGEGISRRGFVNDAQRS